MDLKRLQHLVALADERNFGRAASRVHLSQPAFSRSIQAAEGELDLVLFERGGGEIRCTPAGSFVVERARRLLQESRRLERDVGLYRERVMGDVAIGSGPFPAATLLPPLVQELRTRFPGINTRVMVNNWRYLMDHLRKEELDFFVADTRDVPPGDEFSVTSIVRQRGRFYVRAGHPLLSRKTISMKDVGEFRLTTSRLPAQATEALGRMMGLDSSQELPVAMECDDVHLVKCIALTTDTVMIGTSGIVREELAAGQLQALEIQGVPPMFAEIGIVSLKGRTPSPMADFAMEHLALLAKRQD